MRRRALAIFLCVAGFAGLFTHAIEAVPAAKGGFPPDVPLRITFRNATDPIDRIMSIGPATYTDGEPGVRAFIDSNGWVNLGTCLPSKGNKPGCTSQGRFNFLDFRSQVRAGLPLSSQTESVPANFVVSPLDSSGTRHLSGGFRNIMSLNGETRLSGMKVNYPGTDGNSYTLRFSPNMYPESSHLLVTFFGGSLTCSLSNPDDCAVWVIEAFTGSFTPSPPGSCPTNQLQDIAKLVSETIQATRDFGTFHMPFQMVVSVLPK
jgi:hypothetical protein